MNAPAAQLPAYKPPQFPTDRRIDGERNREGPGGCAKSAHRCGPAANARRREARRRAGRTGGRLHQHDSRRRSDEFPAASSSMRTRARIRRTTTRSALKPAARRLPLLARICRRSSRQRDATKVRFGGLIGGAEGRGGRGRAISTAPPIQADAEASLPSIIEEVKRQLTAERRRASKSEAPSTPRANQRSHVQAVTQAVDSKRAGWNGSPDQHRPRLRRTMAADHERGLVPFLSHAFSGRPQRAVMGSQQAL